MNLKQQQSDQDHKVQELIWKNIIKVLKVVRFFRVTKKQPWMS
jgi:hypothetical protein